MTVFEPGLYRGVPEAIYHGDRGSISSSQARRLLEVSPYRWRTELNTPRKPSPDMEWGTALHTLVLGTGALVIDTGAEKWTTDAVKADVADIRRRGHIPLRPKDFAAVNAAATAVRAHGYASLLFDSGEAELSAWAPDPASEVMMRARADWVRWEGQGRARLVDLKTTSELGPASWMWSVAKYGYHAQEAWYRDVFELCGVEVVGFTFVVVTNSAPFEVFTSELHPRAVDLGRDRNAAALDIYAGCAAVNEWPSHGEQVFSIDIPEKYYRRQEFMS
ncbi:PD-(D/E)XK nuclease-like domain-containing protein [Nocardia puris]|uniref:PD-(D/E)XK nuclease-like domain-containing protein n=1 Tax=Nocardia puris TaxID=208602 RepID=UPI001893CBAB|nr:PD-(D/E)XK nuclease-like domain-containing protein [Nocardia puris]MBF6459834.1 PD-(D/E)XK nuclease-like domain-containing protein [Nocardia puris]